MWDDWLCNSHTGWSPAVMNPMNTIVAMLSKSWPSGASPDRCHGSSWIIMVCPCLSWHHWWSMIHLHPWWSMINDDHYGTQGTNLSRCLQENSDDDMEGGLGWITIELKTGALLRDLFVFSLKQPVLEINSVMTCRLECRHCSVCNIEFPTGEIHGFFHVFSHCHALRFPGFSADFWLDLQEGRRRILRRTQLWKSMEAWNEPLEGGQMGYTHNNDGDILWNWFMNNSW